MSEKIGEYQALARKYRPQTFADVVGQDHVLSALCNTIDAKRIHHAYLLTGTRGIGKTTIARIIAKSLECETGITSKPCLQCDACKAIAAGNYPDVIEIDAASQTKVDDTRQLLENTQYPPLTGRYKIYIIDEVHMLTNNSFNALLKTLEEPPSYVKFILATTDPHKIPTTVLSRCLQFQLKALSVDEIKNRIISILATEGVPCEIEAAQLIARAAKGSMRDALSLCDQAIALGSGSLERKSVITMLGTAGDGLIAEIIDLLAPETEANFAGVLSKFAQISPNFKAVLDDLAIAFHDLALYQMIGDNALGVFTLPQDILNTYAKVFSPESVQLYYQIVLEGIKEYSAAPDGKSAFEMTLLRLLAFSPEKKKEWIGEDNPITPDYVSLQSKTLQYQVDNLPKPPTANHKLNLDNVTASLKLLAENSDLKSDVIVKTSTSTKTQTETEILSPESKKTSGVLSVKEGLGKITSASSFDKKDQDFLSLAEDINNYLTDITSALQIMQDHEVNVKEDGISGQLAKITSLGIELGRSVQPQESRSSYAKNMVEDKEVFLNDPFSGGDVSALSLVAPQEAPIDLDNSQELEDKDDDNGSLSLLDVSHDSISKSESEAQSAVNNEALEEKQSDKNSDNFFIDEDLEYAPDEAEQKNKLKSEIIAKAQEIKFSNEGLNTQDDFSLKHIKSENSFTDHGAACEYTLKTIESDPFDDESPLNCKDIIFSDSDFGCKLVFPKKKKCTNTKLLKETSKEEILNFALTQIQKAAINKRALYFKDQVVCKKGNDAANLPVSEDNDLSDIHDQQVLLNEADEVENQQVDSEISVDDSEIDYTDMPLDNSQDMLFYADVEESVVNEIQDGNPAKVSKQQVQNAYQQSFQNQLSFKGKRLLEPNDFLDEVAKIDPWYQTILKSGYSSGPDFAALLYTIRKQNEADPNKWIIYISDDFKLLATDPTWKHNLVTKFSISNSKPVDIDIELTSQAPEGCPYLQACALFIKQLNATRNALLSNRKLTELLNDLGEDLYKMRIDLYTDVH